MNGKYPILQVSKVASIYGVKSLLRSMRINCLSNLWKMVFPLSLEKSWELVMDMFALHMEEAINH